jgi:nucleotide-binding universal stress UspA family protein
MALEPIGSVVVGVDGSASSRAAALLAAEEAMAWVTPLVVVHAFDDVRPSRLVETIAAEAAAEHPGLAVSFRAVPGEPARVLVRESRDAYLLVVGNQRRPAPRHGPPIGGRVVEQLTRLSPIPLLVHQPLALDGDVELPRPVVVGVDGTAAGQPVVEFAFAEAALRGAPLVAMHVWAHPADRAWPDAWPVPSGPAGGARAAHWLLSDAIDRWADKYPEVEVHRVVRHGLDVPVALTAASRSAQLTVVGAGGSTAEVLLRRAAGPIAIVPEPTRVVDGSRP